MSVINQMLKDLDERQNEQATVQSDSVLPVVKESSKKVLFLIIFVVILINIAGIFVWQLYTENQSLKLGNKSKIIVTDTKQANEVKQKQSNEPITQLKVANTLEIGTDNQKELGSSKQLELLEKSTVGNNKTENGLAVKNNVALIEESQTNNSIVQQKLLALEESTIVESEIQVEGPKSNLSISRKQLTPEELTSQKITQAERALQANDLNKAETLFEDVLLVSPENKVARKQLAALWFGRQSYQAALNLLSQGISQAPDYMEYRLMKARIYLSQGQTASAVDALKSLATLENVEYQSLLATSAQQAQMYKIAANAYSLLSVMQPNAGRWWLGLAVALDSTSRFSEAASAYQRAVNTAELSENARQFARQRLQELGG